VKEDQLDLFGARQPAPEPASELVRLAEAMPSNVRLGTSSWTFPGWAGLVYHRRYPNQRAFVRESLEEYVRFPLFRTVGIDRSFYAPLGADELRSYARVMPEGFLAVMKVWSELTTRVFPRGDRAGQVNRSFLDPERFAAEVAAPVDAAFRERLGVFLVEIPPAPGKVNVKGFAARVDAFLREAPAYRYAFELRDRRLLAPEYLEVLRKHGASHVFNYWSWMPDLREQMRRVAAIPSDTVVVRLMIPPGKRYEDLKRRFDPFDRIHEVQQGMRADVEELVRRADGRETFVIVNNKVEGSSPRTVRALARRLAGDLPKP